MRLVITLVLLLAAASPLARATDPALGNFKIASAEPAEDWNAIFSNKTGWVGADAAYSAPLDQDHVVWLFGDTFWGKVVDGKRTDCVMVNNTLALQIGLAKDASIRFFHGKPKDGKPTSMFTPDDGKGWLWPQAAVRIGKSLYLVLPQIDRTGRGGAFGFKQIGQRLGIVENPDDDPMEWRMKQTIIPFGQFTPDRTTSWGSALLLEGGNVYIYGIDEHGKGFGRKTMIVARAPADHFADFSSWRFAAQTGWSEKPDDAIPLAGGMATEFSVTPLPGGNGYIAVYTENGIGDRIVARTASAPQGPWSAPLLLYTCPEMKQDKGVFCYSAKAHPWAAVGNELIITYCQNTWDFAKVFQTDQFYRPKFVRVKLEANR